MKLKHSIPLSQSRKAFKKPGFALIATLTLMMLLAMLAVALMALVSSQNRIAMQTVLQAEARQQALVGLDVAIGELQVELGADRRVSANSGIINDSANTPQYILGVWDSWSGPLYGTNKLNNSSVKIQSTYSIGRKNMFRRWMVSTRNERESRQFDSVNNLGKRRPGERVCMVGEGTLGNRLTQQHYVYADMIYMPAAGAKNKTAFAWWIGGENQKAKISVENPKEPENTMEMLHRTWDTPAPMIVDNRDLDYLPETIENAAKISTLASVTLLGSSSQEAGMPYFHDVTTTSFTLPINVRTGGFKQDLNLLLNKKSLEGTEFAPRHNQDCPIVEGDDVPKGTDADMPIGSWQNLFAYYNCWPNGDANDADNFTARMLGNVNRPYTRMSGLAYDWNDPLNYIDNGRGYTGTASSSFETRAMQDQGSKYAGYARTPIMLAFMNNFTLLTTANGKEKKTCNLKLGYSPLVLWWNPYNVPMRIRGKQLWSRTLPYKMMYTEYEDIKGKGHKWTGQITADYNSHYQVSRHSETNDIIFQPGEIVFFSLPNDTIAGGTLANPFVEGYNAKGVNNIATNIFTNVPTGEVSGYYLNMNFYTKQGNQPVGRGRGDLPDSYWINGPKGGVFSMFAGYAGPVQRLGSDVQSIALSPQSHALGWYNTSMSRENLRFCDRDRNDSYWPPDMTASEGGNTEGGNTEVEDVKPYYVAAMGVAAKSANPSIDSRVYEGVDFRGKIWQHSNPAFWGSMLVEPDDQERQYHPYQLAALDISGGMGESPMDNIGRNGYLGITSEGEQVSFASVLELPVHPPFSLAGLAGMRLTPGWYHSGVSSGLAAYAPLRRSQYQAGVPGVGIGNSFADPCIPAGDVYQFHDTETSKANVREAPQNASITTHTRIFGDFFDHGLMINDALWDRWFCSSVSDMPSGSGNSTIKAEETLSKFISGEESLPVSRYKKTTTPYKDEQIIQRIMADDGWKHIAQYLMIDGGFNVNSTSVEAWAAVLQGLANRRLVANKNEKLHEVEEGKSRNQVLFSRFMLSTTEKSVDSLGGYSVMQGSPAFRNSAMASAWSEVRMLEPESIRRLAEEMVKQVRRRGPFLNMSDFINRRLDPSSTNYAANNDASSGLSLKGALQAAIDATDINRDFNEVTVRPKTGKLFRFPEAENGSMHTAAPGYLIQSDILASLGNILTVRDDTFTVRAYGCVRNAQDAVLAQAWCEAVLQRTMDYVDPANAPGDVEYNPDGTKGTGLSDTNKVMGRQFRIVSFKWLDHWDI